MHCALTRLIRTNILVIEYGEKCTEPKFRLRRGRFYRFTVSCRTHGCLGGRHYRRYGKARCENRLRNRNVRPMSCVEAQIARAQPAFGIDVGAWRSKTVFVSVCCRVKPFFFVVVVSSQTSSKTLESTRPRRARFGYCRNNLNTHTEHDGCRRGCDIIEGANPR